MTYLIGKRTTEKDKHRLHNYLNDLLICLSLLCIAIEVIKRKRTEFTPGASASFDCRQFDLHIKIPSYAPVAAALDGRYPDTIEVSFIAGRILPLEPGNRTSVQAVLLALIAPIFVQVFVDHKPWLDANLGNTDGWPDLLNFCRVIRNALSHGRRINFANPSAKPVKWYGVEYAPHDNGREISCDLEVGDLIVLLFEMSDEFDRLHVPVP